MPSKPGRVKIVNNAQVFAHLERQYPARRNTRRLDSNSNIEKLIIATGARERFLPFPGWTLPNVFGAGGLQALVKGGLKVEEQTSCRCRNRSVAAGRRRISKIKGSKSRRDRRANIGCKDQQICLRPVAFAVEDRPGSRSASENLSAFHI